MRGSPTGRCFHAGAERRSMSDHDDHGHSHDDREDHGHGHDHDHGRDHHHHHDAESVAVAVVTVSSSRSADEDPAGDYVAAAFEEAGHEVAVRELIPDDYDSVQGTVDRLARRKDTDAVVTTGGTGVTPDDVTPEAVRGLLAKPLPGVGEPEVADFAALAAERLADGPLRIQKSMGMLVAETAPASEP